MSDYVTYRSAKARLGICLRPTKKVVVDNQVVQIPGMRVKFIDHSYQTSNKDIVKALDALLSGEKCGYWGARFQKEPSAAMMAAARKIKNQVAAATKAAVEEISNKDKDAVEEATSFEKFLEKRKGRVSPDNVIVGVRDIHSR